MYLVPWQIFVLGCVCGVFITFFVSCFVIVRLAFKSGVKVEKTNKDKEESSNG